MFPFTDSKEKIIIIIVIKKDGFNLP